MSALPIVALVGRPNVGKSTLFNRLIGRPQAIVEDEPGTTRDRNYGQTTWNDKTFLVVDTGGLDFGNEADIPRAIRQQADMAIEEADVIVFMVDARSGLTALDQEVADQLRLRGRPVVLAANKAESESRRLDSSEFYALGLGDPIPISALNGIDTGDLLDAVAELLPRAEEEDDADDVPRITLVGRPNVGKSSLLNALLQQDRALVSPTPGTTRDSTDTELIHDGRPVILVDTAGIRKRGHIDRGVEHYSVLRAMRAITRSDVAVLVIDATEPLAAQDAHIAGYAWDAAKGLVIVVNKWDLVVPKDDHTMDQYARRLRQELHFVHDAPMVFTSALTRQRVRKILDLALQVRDARLKRVPTGQLNAVIQEALKRHQPVSKSGRLLKLRYVTQARTNPPTFVLFVNDPQLVHFSYRRFLENQIREHFGFSGTAIRLYFRSSREALASPQDRKLLRAGRSQRVPAIGADRGIVGASELDQASATARDSASTHDSAGVRAGDGESRRQPATRRSRERPSPGRDTRERSPVRRPRAEAKRSPEGTSPPVRRPARKSGSSSRL